MPATSAASSATSAARRKPDPCTIVIFGAAGDLSYRKLMPSLFHLFRGEHLPENMLFVGVDRVELEQDAFRLSVRQGHSRGIGTQASALPKAKDWEKFTSRLFYFKGDVTDEKSMAELGVYIDGLEKERQLGSKRVFYLSLPPAVFPKGLKTLEAAGLVGAPRRRAGEWSRVIIEKPFGRDLDSALKLNKMTQDILAENETYRIDHYLGKETVQNVLFFRFANGMFEPLWNQKYIDHVQITAAEPLGLERRTGYYETAGAMRDMIQNHIMQVMSLIAMEPPVTFDAESIRDEKVKVLKALRPISPENAVLESVRGQYGPGRIGRSEVPGYRQEEGANPESAIETYAALRVYIDNWRWAGTPFYLRSGKRMTKADTEIAITFKKPPHMVFTSLATPPQPNQLILQIQPNDGIELQFEAKVPGGENKVQSVNMDFRYPDAFVVENPSAYERLLLDCMLGDQTLFLRSDEVEAAWRFISPIHKGWEAAPAPAFPNYKAGSLGPAEADEWLAKDGRTWHNL